MSRIFAIASKEIRQLRRDRLTFGMIVGIPVMQMLLFGYAINFDVRGLSAGVVDEARTSMSRALVADMQASGVVKVTEYAPSIGDLRRSLRSGDVSIGVYIPADFERRRLIGDRPLAQLLVDGSEPTIENIARAFVAMPLPKRDGVYGASARQVFEVRTEYNPEKRTAVQVVPALIGVILTMTMTMFTAVAIVRERERGNLELLITTPASSLELMLGKLIPYVFIGLLQTTLGRPFTSAATTLAMMKPQTEYGDRLNQFDFRFTKIVGVGHGKIDLNFDVYNAFNSDAVLTQSNTFGASWWRPTTVIQPRFLKLSARWDF